MFKLKTEPKVTDNLEIRWHDYSKTDPKYNAACRRLQELREEFKKKRAALTTGDFKKKKENDAIDKIIAGEVKTDELTATPKSYYDTEREIILIKQACQLQESKVEQMKPGLFLQAINEHDIEFQQAYSELVQALENVNQLLQFILRLDYKARYEAKIVDIAIPKRWQPALYIAERFGVNPDGKGYLSAETAQIRTNLKEWPKNNEVT